jgi:hypothetical protein
MAHREIPHFSSSFKRRKWKVTVLNTAARKARVTKLIHYREGFLESSGSWHVTPCRPVKVNRRFKGAYCLHLHGLCVNKKRNQHKAGCKQGACCLLPAGLLIGLLFSPENGGNIFLRTRLTFTGLQGVIYQKTELFIILYFSILLHWLMT